MAKRDKKTRRMDADRGSRAKPGSTILAADRGAGRFDLPGDRVVIVDDEGFKLHDRQAPDNE